MYLFVHGFVEMNEIEKSLEILREQLKSQVKNLRDIEGAPELQGFEREVIRQYLYTDFGQ